jgi:hypothetical protein
MEAIVVLLVSLEYGSGYVRFVRVGGREVYVER